jgi:hypothetical protein
MLGSSRVAAQLAASREGLGSMSDRSNYIMTLLVSGPLGHPECVTVKYFILGLLWILKYTKENKTNLVLRNC